MPDQPAPRLVGLDGMRGLLALAVTIGHVVGHLAPTSTAPLHIGLLAQAVVVFFTLSGFLIFLPFCRAIVTGTPLPALGRYTRRRLSRVYPAYVVIFLIANFAVGAVFTSNVLESSVPRDDAGTGRITNVGDVLLNLTLLQNLVPSHVQTGLNVSWSLTTELGFYLVVPLVAAATYAVARRSSRPAWQVVLLPIVLLTVVALAAKAVLTAAVTPTRSLEQVTFGPHGLAVLAESTVALADLFAAGMVAALVYVLIGQGALASWTGRRLHLWCGAVIVVVGGAALVGLKAQSAYANTLLAVAAAALLVLIVEPTARHRPSPIGRLLDLRPIRFLGTTSLSIYLWHFPVIVLVTRWGWYGPDTLLGALWSVALVVSITLVLGSLTYRFVEAPAMQRGRRFAQEPRN